MYSGMLTIVKTKKKYTIAFVESKNIEVPTPISLETYEIGAYFIQHIG